MVCFMTNSTMQHPIKAIVNFRTLTPDAVVTTAANIKNMGYNNPNFAGAPAPPVDQATLKAAKDELVANSKTAATISGLTPGTTYVIQARAVTKAGYTEYGQPILQMVI